MADAKIRIQGDVSGFTDSMQQAERSVDGFSVSLGKVDKNANSLKAAMKTATKQAQDLAFQLSKMSDVELQSDFGQQLQAQFQTAMKAAADLKDQFGDVNQEIKNLASDTTGLDAFTQGIGVMSSGLSGLASIYGLVGGNVESFTKALVAVNAVQNISNTITGIANALQQQSALMVGLRAAKNAILGTSITAVTAAETANTAALGAETAATTAATAAQTALNAAMLANPYVLAGAAVAALCVGVYALVTANDSMTESEQRKMEALQATAAEMEKQADAIGERIGAFNILKHAYEENGRSLDKMKKNMANFDEVCKKANITIGDQYTADLALAQASQVVVKAFRLEATAAQIQAAIYGKYADVIKKVADIKKRFAKGDTIDQGDLDAIGLSIEQARSLGIVQEAGLDDLFASVFQPSAQDYKYVGNNLEETADKLLSFSLENADEEMKYLFAQLKKNNEELAASIKEIGDKGLDYNKLTNGSNKVAKSTKGVKNAAKDAKTELELLDQEIGKTEDAIKNLNKSTEGYETTLNQLKSRLASLKIKRLEFIDNSTLEGLIETKNALQDIKETLPANSELIDKVNNALDDANNAILEAVRNLDATGSELKAASSAAQEYLNKLKRGTKEYKAQLELVKTLKSAEAKDNEARAEDLKEKFPEGTVPALQQQINEYQKLIAEEQKKPIESQSFTNIQQWKKDIADLKKQIKELEKMYEGIEVKSVTPFKFDPTSYREMPRPKKVTILMPEIDAQIDRLNEVIEEAETALNGKISIGVDTSELKKSVEGAKAARDELIKVKEEINKGWEHAYDDRDIDKMTQRELGGIQNYIQGLIDEQQAYIKMYEESLETATGLDEKYYENLKKQHEAIKGELEKKAIYIEIKADIKQYKSQIAELQETTAKDFLGATEGLYSAFADLPKQLDECENAAEGFFKVMEAGFSIFDQIKTIIQDLQEMSELFKMLNGAETSANKLFPNGVGTVSSIPADKLEPLIKQQSEITAQQERETEASGAVAQAANQAAGALDNLAGSATKAAGAIGAGASPQPPASEGVDMVSLAGGGADSEFEVTPVVNEGALREQSDKIKEILSSGAGSGLAEAMKLPEGADKIADTIKEQSAAFAELASVKEGAAVAQEGLTAAQQIGNVATEAGTVIAGANTVATEGQSAATKEQAIANVGEAVSETAKQNAKTGPWGWVVAIAGAAALFAALMSMMKFAEGGIVGGSTTIGDRVVARLNAGEMVLNKNQQSKLFKMINDGTISGSNVNVSGSVRVRGSDLEVALRNYDKMRKTNRN